MNDEPQPQLKMLILSFLLSLPLQSWSFSPAARFPLQTNAIGSDVPITSRLSPSSTLLAKKRRRRKTVSPGPTTPSDELPDFEDGESASAEQNSVQDITPSSPSTVVSTSLKPKPIITGGGLNDQLAEEPADDIIMEAMRGKGGGSTWQPPQNIEATLNDRRLEKLMNFDAMIERDGDGSSPAIELPDFEEVISRRKKQDASQEGGVDNATTLVDTQGMGKKAARNAKRKAVAMQREAEAEAEKSPFEDILKDFSFVKLLENGAWVGIGLLVLWEIYINSPFFDRAMPMIPPVYDTPPGM